MAADATEYTDSDLSPATSYRHRVRACNAAGCSAPSAEVSATTDDVPPSVPDGLTAVAIDATSIELGWTDVSDNKLRFELERWSEGLPGWEVVASLASGSTEAVDLPPAAPTGIQVTALASDRIGGLDG